MRAEPQTACAAAAVSPRQIPVPPRIKKPASATALLAGVALAVVFMGLGAVVFFFNPATCGFYPECQFHELTGLNCPGCGGTRSVYALLHGHWEAALKDNALFVLVLPALALRGAWFGTRKFLRQSVGQFIPPKYLWGLLIVAVVFTVLRNLPEFAFLSP
jgi:Protein of unknown function (DUF2752)